MNSTTIEIYTDDLAWWRLCCKRKDKTSAKTFNDFRKAVDSKYAQDFYATLPRPSFFRKPLQGIKINKDKRKI
jgi:hypothetical protein